MLRLSCWRSVLVMVSTANEYVPRVDAPGTTALFLGNVDLLLAQTLDRAIRPPLVVPRFSMFGSTEERSAYTCCHILRVCRGLLVLPSRAFVMSILQSLLLVSKCVDILGGRSTKVSAQFVWLIYWRSPSKPSRLTLGTTPIPLESANLDENSRSNRCSVKPLYVPATSCAGAACVLYGRRKSVKSRDRLM
ncbi:hypothetical protein H310_08836 [Aphanomyces invadans]|uniref:Secreted protein n=1 Tax=Aphanomyces invadans TaxID=157072 RepID=A0A024TXP5_9STRA|nr:hypothetical protein H310_08836 [Aphanomyces invadans]ETV98769.1 hypothetical protein H310_08836 [Aphanomyces invadans]|eukprot:XP_008872966.1 hypothetical protein H310_08836 [Aphanomyces invadans]